MQIIVSVVVNDNSHSYEKVNNNYSFIGFINITTGNIIILSITR